MITTITNESTILSVRQRIGVVAFGMLSDEIGFIEGAIELVSLHHKAALEESDPDFTLFVAIASETDNLPIGKSRQHWSNQALVKHQPEIDAAIIWAKQFGTLACQSLVRRFHAK